MSPKEAFSAYVRDQGKSTVEKPVVRNVVGSIVAVWNGSVTIQSGSPKIHG